MAKHGKAGAQGRAGVVGNKEEQHGKVTIYTPEMVEAFNAERAKQNSEDDQAGESGKAT